MVRAPEAVSITSLVQEIPAELREQMGKLPFKPLAPELALARTMKVPVMNRFQGETAPLQDDVIAKAAPALPFVRNTNGAGVAPFPQLTLEQYASLRATLWVWPEWSAEILRQYHVRDEGVHWVLNEHWSRQLAASPETRATFEKALADYTAWLRTQRG